jgi:hypothetical protein
MRKKKYHLARWSAVCTPKDQGRLGIYTLEVKNMALLGKWLFKLLTKDGAWQTILKRKYVGTNALSQVLWKPGVLHFWAGLMATKKIFFCFGTFSSKDGSEIRFWENRWLDNATSENSILHCIILFVTKAIPSLKYLRLRLRMWRSGGIYPVKGLYLGIAYFNVWAIYGCKMNRTNCWGSVQITKKIIYVTPNCPRSI